MNVQKNKNVVIVGSVLVVLIVVGLFLTGFGQNEKKNADGSNVLPDVELIPTVTDDVKVAIVADSKKREITLTIDGVPNGTELIDYELSYTKIVDDEPVADGTIGTITYDGEDPVEREITLGTCSSGRCTYHEGVTSINALLKFQGEYGSQIFEREFEI